jgi:dTDP-4-dehydrorhamnose reductase
MLGRALHEELQRRGWLCRTPSRSQLDLARPETLDRFFSAAERDAEEYVINCAAWTDVDGAETDEGAALRVNAQAIGQLAAACGARRRLVTFSSDYVFDGAADTPYAPDAPRAPINAYGRSKAAGESVLEGLPADRWLNIRTSWLYAPWGRNFVLTMAHLLSRSPDEVRVVDDQRGRPSSAEQLARTTLDLLAADASGHWHATDAGECTWFELASEIARLTGSSARVVPCSSDEFPRPARRPQYSVLDISATERAVGLLRSWQTEVRSVLQHRKPEPEHIRQ